MKDNKLSRLILDQEGVTTVEYAIMLALIAIAVAVASPGIGNVVTSVFTTAATAMA
jgi:Flp pilus assembly pilin Flp